jgi:uncharacterized protein (DUF924 family)
MMLTAMTTRPTQAEVADIVEFWRTAGPGRWFAKDDAFDREFGKRFLALHEKAARGEFAHWLDTAEGALALVLLLDQYPRNAFRGSGRAFATDALAREAASEAVAAGHDLAVAWDLQMFFYLPFEHSEDLADQERSVELTRRLGGEALLYAEKHLDVIRRFGRFPHRNAILGRTTTEEEQRFLDDGGFGG